MWDEFYKSTPIKISQHWQSTQYGKYSEPCESEIKYTLFEANYIKTIKSNWKILTPLSGLGLDLILRLYSQLAVFWQIKK